MVAFVKLQLKRVGPGRAVAASFSHNFGELVIRYDAGNDVTLIQGDVDGDGQADFTIKADGDHHDFSSFVL
jgi:hypothetical protein